MTAAAPDCTKVKNVKTDFLRHACDLFNFFCKCFWQQKLPDCSDKYLAQLIKGATYRNLPSNPISFTSCQNEEHVRARVSVRHPIHSKLFLRSLTSPSFARPSDDPRNKKTHCRLSHLRFDERSSHRPHVARLARRRGAPISTRSSRRASILSTTTARAPSACRVARQCSPAATSIDSKRGTTPRASASTGAQPTRCEAIVERCGVYYQSVVLSLFADFLPTSTQIIY